MQHRIIQITFLIFFLLTFKNHLTATNFTQQIKKEKLILNEIQKCLFLEKQLLPDKPTTTFKQKLIKIALKIAIPTITSLIICKIIDMYFYPSSKTNSKVKNILVNHVETIQTDASSNLGTNSNTESLNRNVLPFLALFVSTYFITKFFMSEKEPTDLQRLTNFIKDWPNNKIQIPKTFQEQFESLYSDYVKNNKINISEQEAEKIVFQIISQIIEYKTSLPRSTHLFTKI